MIEEANYRGGVMQNEMSD